MQAGGRVPKVVTEVGGPDPRFSAAELNTTENQAAGAVYLRSRGVPLFEETGGTPQGDFIRHGSFRR